MRPVRPVSTDLARRPDEAVLFGFDEKLGQPGVRLVVEQGLRIPGRREWRGGGSPVIVDWHRDSVYFIGRSPAA